MTGLELSNIHKTFDATQALKGVSFVVPQGKIVAVLGPSGCGKSTLMGIIAGLMRPDEGNILWDGKDMQNTPTHRRGFGLMFQDFALFPHRNVSDNIAFGLQMAHLPVEQARRRVAEVLELVGLPGFERRDVNTLSGGEGQRVALARALAPHPRLLMLDEPLGSLDRNLRERLVLDLHDILRRSSGIEHSVQTTLYVTHDQEEAFVIADLVVIMNQGKVEQTGAPEELYRRPGSEFVARFLGLKNLLPGEVKNSPSGLLVHTPIGAFPAPGAAPGQCLALVRPDTSTVQNTVTAKSPVQPASGAHRQITGAVIGSSFRGSQRRVEIAVNDFHLVFDFISSATIAPPGEMITLTFDPAETIQLINQ